MPDLKLPTDKIVYLPEGWGYWKTNNYPIGGSFYRAPKDGLIVIRIIREFPMYKGCNIEVEFIDGTHAALDKSQLKVV